VVESGRLTPAHVTPVSGAAVHTGKVARISAVRALEGGPGVSIGPGVAPVSGAIDQIVAGKLLLPPFSFMAARYTSPLSCHR